MTIPLDSDPARCAQRRYERANELESQLQRRQQVTDPLSPMPTDPLAYLVCYHLDAVEGNYPKSMAGHLDAERKAVEGLCKRMEATGLLERVGFLLKTDRRNTPHTAPDGPNHSYYAATDTAANLLENRSEQAHDQRHLHLSRR